MSVDPLALNDRARAIFRVVVESYLQTGMPVGSRSLSRAAERDGSLSLSPASIRNVMQDLEEQGLLAAPHVSAGRMPTEQGLRLFVDGMMQVAEPSAAERATIEQQMTGAGPIEAALAATTAALSDLSACAGVVLVPKIERRLKQFSLVQISPAQALAVLVGEDGQLENRILPIPAGTLPGALAEAANYLSHHIAGRSLGEAMERIGAEIAGGRAALDSASRDLVARGLAVWSSDSAERPVLIVRGQAQLLDDVAIQDLERVRRLLDELEGKEEIARLLDTARQAEATRIFIGAENKLFSLSGSSVIAAPYRDSRGKVVGVVGVIGPTRLNYARIVPIVDFTAQSLSKLMGN